MPIWIQRLQAAAQGRADLARALMAPLVVVMVLAMMVLPLPPLALDLLFTFNIAIALLVVLVSAHMVRPLDFAAFPTILLITTLLRLSLNVASTRVVLLEGHTGTGAAGAVIEAFGHFLIGGNFAVGLIVFAILVVINFIVVTKGAERIAEVGARFTLDAMPGKQMAIDADLNAGLIDEAEAKRRRLEVSEEADFFGAMDGASKFVRGDAVAGILILFINVVGGFIIGMASHGMAAGDAARAYVLLAVGDALVAQIPGLLISTAAAMVVSRVGKESDVGTQIRAQVFGQPRAIGLAGGIVGALGLIPGMPHAVFLLIGAALGALAYSLHRRQQAAAAAGAQADAPAAPLPGADASWADVQPVETVAVELGMRLLSLVDAGRGGALLPLIKGIRKKFAQDIGFLPPSVHIRDNLGLRNQSSYRILLRGVVVGEGEVYPGLYMLPAIGRIDPAIKGIAGVDPAFGIPVLWIDEQNRMRAKMDLLEPIDCEKVVGTHLSHLMQQNAARLLGRVETQALVEHATQLAPKLVEDVIPKMVGIAAFQKVLQLLLEEGVPVRDLRSIVEALAEHAGSVTDPAELARRVRIQLSPAIVQQIFGPVQELPVIALAPPLEQLVAQALGSPHGAALDPGVAETLARGVHEATQRREEADQPACLLVPDAVRAPLARLLKRAVPTLKVLAHSEIPDTHTVRVDTFVGAPA